MICMVQVLPIFRCLLLWVCIWEWPSKSAPGSSFLRARHLQECADCHSSVGTWWSIWKWRGHIGSMHIQDSSPLSSLCACWRDWSFLWQEHTVCVCVWVGGWVSGRVASRCNFACSCYGEQWSVPSTWTLPSTCSWSVYEEGYNKTKRNTLASLKTSVSSVQE